MPWIKSVFISFYYYSFFALLSIPIYFICRKISFDTLSVPVFIFIHFILALLCSALWLFMMYGSWYLQEGKRIFQIVEIEKTIGWQFTNGLTLYLLIVGIYYTLIYYKHFREKELRETELRLLTRDAELKALKMQINPHFLFNSLNSINALVTQNPNQAREMIARLSDLFRLTLENRDKMIMPLKEELDVARLYLEIEKIRFGDRLKTIEDIEPALLSLAFPAMVLQPLLENAVKHGISGKRGCGTIRLTIKKTKNEIHCNVYNTYQKKYQQRQSMTINGTGLSNINQRLNLLYKDNYSLVIDDSISGLFRITVTIPVMFNEGIVPR
jgi:sensor histidine kinase YesM